MKTLNIPFEDDEHEEMLLNKGEETSWHDYFLELSRKRKKISQ